MKCANPGCNRGIGLIAYQRGWFGKRRYCSRQCRYAFMADAPKLQQKRDRPLLRRLVIAFIAFVGLTVPATFAMAILVAPPARPQAKPLPGCDRNIAEASARVTAMQVRIRDLSGMDRAEICTVTRLYFLELVKARAVTALCRADTERDHNLDHLEADVAHINDAIAKRCL